MNPMPASGARRLGFSLIELMVVLVLMGIMMATIIPEMKGTYEDALLRTNGRKLLSVFDLAYTRAITVNQLHRVRLDRKTGHYSVEHPGREGEKGGAFVPVRDVPGSDGDIDPRITIEIRKADDAPSAAADPGARFISGDDLLFGKRDDAIGFYPDGTAEAGEIVLRDRDGFGIALRINPVTARVRAVELERE
ncbi:MAG: pilus assembly FimT family protein [Limisphaerales bacterium]